MKNIYVGNLPYETSEDAIRDLFSNHGEVSSVRLISDRETGRLKGFGFVEMPDDSAGDAAIEAMDGYELDGRPLKVNEARPRDDNRRGGRRPGGRRSY